jgi:hypothetical protein
MGQDPIPRQTEGPSDRRAGPDRQAVERRRRRFRSADAMTTRIIRRRYRRSDGESRAGAVPGGEIAASVF